MFHLINPVIVQRTAVKHFVHFNKEDYLLLQNEISNLDYALQTAAQKGMKIVLNPSPITEGLLQCPLDLVDLFVLNEVEGKALSGELSDDYDIILQALAEKYPLHQSLKQSLL